MLMTDIHVRSFTGGGLKTYLHGIAKLRAEVFREYPYLEEPNFFCEMQLLNKLVTCKESIGVLIFDHMTLVGVSLGYPLKIEEPALLKPFLDRQLDPNYYFFFGDSVLLKQYRGRGIGHHFFDARDAHIQHYPQFRHSCFYFPDDVKEDASEPSDFIPLFDFWRKRGYIHHPNVKTLLPWNKIDDPETKERQVSFWIKSDLNT